MTEIPVLGDTDKERAWFAQGYRMGMIAAAEIVAKAASDAGEQIGGGPAGPLRGLVNTIATQTPSGNIKVRYSMT